ncbi:hypothetical protein OB69_02255 [Roseivirga seohaensis subsp. aquiponti]|uniref:Uracil-DNA glycosylase-like domain-containing protein n=1 Tax=Roseivirga seohaensis subsp. aquiponti TaxID=1566026 RepID=A0A0L8AQ32_9BACT|nr:hypothetical protein [Roseivirga seohaensis]KOF04356.1 hypothetical protein OB69_02255 [Roseivirga seohaensis subsp. aquiponti]
MSNLKWKPFVGKNYQNSEKKMLLIGESHYIYDTKESQVSANSKEFTQKVVDELAIKQWKTKSPFFQNINKLFLGAESNTNKFWSEVAFYNFIQRPMRDAIKEKPSKSDFDNAWVTLIDVLVELKPKVCLFLGNSASNRMEKALRNEGRVEHGKLRYISKVGSNWFKKVELNIEGDTIQCLFIKHPSAYFSIKKWRDELSKDHEYLFNLDSVE